MKHVSFISVFLAMTVTRCLSQPADYYSGRDTVYGEKVTYLITDFGRSSLYLDNTLNLRDKILKYNNGKDLEKPEPGKFWIYPTFQISPQNNKQIYKAMFKTFSKEQIGKMYDLRWARDNNKFERGITIELTVLGGDASIAEVSISFPKHPIYTSIPPDKYYELEQNIKRYVKIRPDKRVKKMAWVHLHVFCTPTPRRMDDKRFERLADKYGENH